MKDIFNIAIAEVEKAQKVVKFYKERFSDCEVITYDQYKEREREFNKGGGRTMSNHILILDERESFELFCESSDDFDSYVSKLQSAGIVFPQIVWLDTIKG